MRNITLIAAIGKNRELGYKNNLIWKIPEDLKFFKDNTIGKQIVMGMNTLNSLPKLLPDRKHNLVEKRLKEMKENPDSRRHIISMWQDDDYELPHGLKPCAFMTIWNVRHGRDGVDYLDMTLIQRSSDFATAGCINQVQYMVFLMLFARHLGLTPGIFTWKPINVQIYDRHVEQVYEMLDRDSVECQPEIWLNPDITNFYDFTPKDIEVRGYPKKLIREKNPQLQFPLGI